MHLQFFVQPERRAIDTWLRNFQIHRRKTCQRQKQRQLAIAYNENESMTKMTNKTKEYTQINKI